MADTVAVLRGAARSVRDLEPDGLTSTELTDALAAFQELRAAADAAEAKVLARWDAEGVWRSSGAKSGAAWLAKTHRLPIQVTRQRLKHARALRSLPDVAQAWADGEIDRAHLVTMLGKRTPRTAAVFDTDHKVLLESARTRGFVDFKRHCDLWEQIVDQDGAEQRAEDGRAARELHLSQTIGGMWFGNITLDPVSGEIINETLRRIERQMFEADWADARERVGCDPLILDLARTPAQRRADALVEMATRARTAPPDGKRPAPLFTVLVGYETFAGPIIETHNRTTLTPGTLAPWLDRAYLERVVFDTPARVIDVGQRTRFFTGALRRAIEVRDRTCFHPYCDEIPERPEIDHIIEHAKGGLTTQEHGRLGCHFHNHRRNTHPDDDDDPDGSDLR